MKIGIDPGPFVSHVVCFADGRVYSADEMDNDKLIERLEDGRSADYAIEDFVPYGSPVSADSIRTIKLIGVAEFLHVRAISCPEVKLCLCGTITQIGDKQVREALIELFGPGKEAAIGKKKSPGPLYGIKSHFWAALAVAVVADWENCSKILTSSANN